MNNTYKVLKSDTDFLAAALSESKVSVWNTEESEIHDTLIDYGGVVQGYSEDAIKIAGSRFLRQMFEFRLYIK